MKQASKYVLVFIFGFVCSAAVVLYAAMECSQVWQSELRAKVLYGLQTEGLAAARKSEWANAISSLEAANRVGSTPIEAWKLFFPVYGWSVYSLAPTEENSFRIIHDSVVAYSLDQSGRGSEAERAYEKLKAEYPGKDRQYFETVAKGVISSPAK